MLCAGGAGGHCRQFAASKLPRSRSPPVRRPTAPGDIATKGRHGSLGQWLVPCIGLGHLSRTLAVTGACRGLSGSLRCVLGSADAGLLHARAPLQHWHWDSPGWHCPSPLSFQLRWRLESACLCRSPPPSHPVCIEHRSSPTSKAGEVPVAYSCSTTTRCVLPPCEECRCLPLDDVCGPCSPFSLRIG